MITPIQLSLIKIYGVHIKVYVRVFVSESWAYCQDHVHTNLSAVLSAKSCDAKRLMWLVRARDKNSTPCMCARNRFVQPIQLNQLFEQRLYITWKILDFFHCFARRWWIVYAYLWFIHGIEVILKKQLETNWEGVLFHWSYCGLAIISCVLQTHAMNTVRLLWHHNITAQRQHPLPNEVCCTPNVSRIAVCAAFQIGL